MQRRDLLQLSSAFAAVCASGLIAQRAGAQGTPVHDHAAMASNSKVEPRRYDSLIPSFQSCTAAVSACIAHCQTLLAEGDKSLGLCLRTALDCDVTCGAVLKAAELNSSFTPGLARTAVAAMDACAMACEPHVDHHAECKACRDACLSAIDAARKLG